MDWASRYASHWALEVPRFSCQSRVESKAKGSEHVNSNAPLQKNSAFLTGVTPTADAVSAKLFIHASERVTKLRDYSIFNA